LFNKLKQQLGNVSRKHNLHPSILTTYWLGLLSIRHHTQYPEILHDLPPPLQKVYQYQTRLGWDQLYHGRLAIHWASAIDELHPELPITGQQITIQMTQVVWSYILATWMLHNRHLHQTAENLSTPNYQLAVTSFYERGQHLPPGMQAALFQRPLQEMLTLPPATL